MGFSRLRATQHIRLRRPSVVIDFAHALDPLRGVTMLFLYLLVFIAAPVLAFARQARGLREPRPHIVKHGMFPGSINKHSGQSSKFGKRAPINRRQAGPPASCGSGDPLTTKAPKSNIFAGLTNDEAAAVTSFLHRQSSLNLTAAATATE